jgi:hypothetical protein
MRSRPVLVGCGASVTQEHVPTSLTQPHLMTQHTRDGFEMASDPPKLVRGPNESRFAGPWHQNAPRVAYVNTRRITPTTNRPRARSL